MSTGIVSTLQRDNAKVACRVAGTGQPPEWLFDPQTSGGLLAAVRPERVAEVVQRLNQVDYRVAGVVGEVMAISPDEAPGVLLH